MSEEQDDERVRRAKMNSKQRRGETGERKRSVNSRRSVTGELGQSVAAGGARQDDMALLQLELSHIFRDSPVLYYFVVVP